VKGKIAQAKAGKNEALAGKAQAQAAREEVSSGIRQARAQVQSAGVMLSYTSLYAPFKGVVTKKFSETGAMATPGQPLLRIESLTSLQLEVPVPESRVKDIPLNKPVTISIDALNRKIRGVVKTYIPSGDAATHTFKAKIALPPVEGLLPGMYGRIQLNDRNRTALVIPAEALVEKVKTRGVFKILTQGDRSTALFVPVEVGPKVQGDVEVQRGLSPADQVIVGPPEGLEDGQQVKSRKKGS
jgi:RND family efflux transporter MFP subunit